MKNLTIKSALIFLYVFMGAIVAQAQGSIEGTIKDENTEETVPFANVALKVGDKILTSTTTDYDGYFVFENVAQGDYIIYVSSQTAFQDYTVKINDQDLVLSLEFNNVNVLGEVPIIGPKKPIYVLTKEKIEVIDSKVLAETKVRNIVDIVKYTGKTVPTDEGLSFKGSRPGTAVYYIDGIRTYGELYMPMSAVDKIEVYMDGVPAKYGNTTAGVIVVETKSFIDFY